MSDTVQKLPERADCIKRTGEPCVGFKGFLERQYLSQRCHLDELDRLEAKLAKAMEALPDDLRAAGWTVAVHNDYRQNGEAHTFWLFTRGTRAVKGEGRTDAEALNNARRTLSELEDK